MHPFLYALKRNRQHALFATRTVYTPRHKRYDVPLYVYPCGGNMLKNRGLLISILLCSSFTLHAANDLPTVYFKCGKAKIWADFHDNDKLDLTLGHTTYVMHSVMSGSGARYETPKGTKPHVVFWNKGNTATLSIGNKNFPMCQQTSK